MSNPYSPMVVEGETSAEIWFERSLLDGEFLTAVAYGIHLAVFSISAYFVTRVPANGKVSWPFFGYLVLLFACGTINLASGIKFAEMAWIDDRDIPGGPVAFNVTMYSVMVVTLGNAAYITANFLADGVLIWRCFVVYGRSYLVIMIPTIAFMASTGLSILTVYQAARPMASIWSQSAVVIAVPYWSLSIALNTVVSMMIVGRLLWFRQATRKTLGPRHGALYAGIAAMFVESAAMYSITGLVYIICFARNSNVQNLVLGILSQVECMAPELIILRVALGRAWSPESSNGSVTTGIGFNTNSAVPEGDSGGMVSIFGSSRATKSGGEGTQVDSTYDMTKSTQPFGAV